MNWREFLEGLIIVACGIILLSPEFNTLFNIPIVSAISGIPDDLISHLAFGLLPIIIIYFIDAFREN